MIPREIAAPFPTDVRQRGEGYFRSGAVLITSATPQKLLATVRGTDSYAVEMHARPGDFIVSCSCPFAADNGICKHLWATLRMADLTNDLERMLQVAGPNPGLVAGFGVDGDELDDGPPPPAPRQRKPKATRAPEWKVLLDDARRRMEHPSVPAKPKANWPEDRRLVYIADMASMYGYQGLIIELGTERRRPDGSWEPPVGYRLGAPALQSVPDPRDAQILQMLIGAAPSNPWDPPRRELGPFMLQGGALTSTLRLICETGRCRLRRQPGDRSTLPMRFDDGPPWRFHVRLSRSESGEVIADAVLRRPDAEMLISEPLMLHSAGILVMPDSFARFDDGGAFVLVPVFRERGRLVVSTSEVPSFLEAIYSLPRRPELDLPPDTQVNEVRDPPRPGVIIHSAGSAWRGANHRIEPFVDYGAVRVPTGQGPASLFDRTTLTVRHRVLEREHQALARLTELGAKEDWVGRNDTSLSIHPKKLGAFVAELVSEGWRVESQGGVYRAPGEMRASVRSGIDWFELSAGVQYGDVEVALSEMLAARRAGQTTVELPNGDVGIIPIDWLARLAPLAAGATGSNGSGALRFKRSQTALLDALLAAAPEPDVDTTFEQARAELRAFERVAPADPPASFCGVLRDYQREGLGWLHFLQRFQLGGCLADDMGLGKTIQVLALLETRRTTIERAGRPSLVVVPRSLVFNWLREAERFAPALKLLDFTGTSRRADEIADSDVVITTYGTLRRDAPILAGIDWDYAILDEAQAIKSANSASAKAARLLRASYRLALTGTPIENRLEELWSLFEFLNPGMLGASTTFASLVRLSKVGDEEGSSPADRGVLGRALRPVILRRTKSQVATELPARIEQTLHVDLEGPQRKFYDGLLTSTRRDLMERIDRVGMNRARMHVLEALLRLRQAACHPSLADPRKADAPSAKLDALIPALEEVTAEGHKALVFSQFTSFLSLVRARLDKAGTVYEYLDGQTRDRESRVARFQEDAECRVFLISLKAGGHGLNLTAADYVFILDPWWNPAVEAQAVDRAHRIGQTRQVIATRIVARDTIEEKILELQASKRALADAILGQDQGVLAGIGRAELEMLLG